MPRHLRRVITASNGLAVRSKFEALVLADLDKRRVAYAYEPDKLVWYAGVRNATCGLCNSADVRKRRVYIPDVKLADGSYVEIKGLFTADDRATVVGARRDNPGTTIRLLFMRDNWLTKKRAKRYSEWAAKNEFEWAVGIAMPAAWIPNKRRNKT